MSYELEKEAGEAVLHNNKQWRKRAGKLRDMGAFRTALPRQTWERIDQPKFDGKVHTVMVDCKVHAVMVDGMVNAVMVDGKVNAVQAAR